MATVPDADPRRVNIERRILNLDVRSIAEWLDEPRKAPPAQGEIRQK